MVFPLTDLLTIKKKMSGVTWQIEIYFLMSINHLSSFLLLFGFSAKVSSQN